MNDSFVTSTPTEPSNHDTALRIFVLGTVYAAATFFAVVFSPAIGVIPQNPATEVNRFADAGF